MGLFDLFKQSKSEAEIYMSKRQNEMNNDKAHIDRFFDSNNTTTTLNTEYTSNSSSASFVIEDIFVITGRGVVVTGQVKQGSFSVGDPVKIQKPSGICISTTITGIEQFRKQCQTINQGDNAGLLLTRVAREDLVSGDLIIK